ncbi:hypothetical protein N9744_01265 [bacterium]|nr:hypothetical protein [bacterium]
MKLLVFALTLTAYLSAPAFALDARALPVKWSGKSFCSKSTKVESKSIVGTLTANSSQNFMLVIEMPSIKGSSTITLKLKGDQVSGSSPNKELLGGRVSPSLKRMTLVSGVRPHDLMTCIFTLKAKS